MNLSKADSISWKICIVNADEVASDIYEEIRILFTQIMFRVVLFSVRNVELNSVMLLISLSS